MVLRLRVSLLLSDVEDTWVGEKSRGNTARRGRRSMGKQAQMIPELASMTDHMVAGMGPPVSSVSGGGELERKPRRKHETDRWDPCPWLKRPGSWFGQCW